MSFCKGCETVPYRGNACASAGGPLDELRRRLDSGYLPDGFRRITTAAQAAAMMHEMDAFAAWRSQFAPPPHPASPRDPLPVLRGANPQERRKSGAVVRLFRQGVAAHLSRKPLGHRRRGLQEGRRHLSTGLRC